MALRVDMIPVQNIDDFGITIYGGLDRDLIASLVIPFQSGGGESHAYYLKYPGIPQPTYEYSKTF